ncbi:hypothetical protein [Cellulosilyticum sp. I15G10I2]|uniref:hypothetical protein n=1 Tax=Cellulosilyticum sp. I15G10I2 TaxID=1892843 RepID=UPI00085C6917|nr:hypothetical protein [Cellulosilyticum sp. I15G10I2]
MKKVKLICGIDFSHITGGGSVEINQFIEVRDDASDEEIGRVLRQVLIDNALHWEWEEVEAQSRFIPEDSSGKCSNCTPIKCPN